VPARLKRYYGAKPLHFITGSCHHRLPMLGEASHRDLSSEVFEQARQQFRFVVAGYVVMPEPFHLLISEPEEGDPSVVMKVVKERFTRILRKRTGDVCPIWQRRFYDFNV
jgi:REP-associated tyrosine transposase